MQRDLAEAARRGAKALVQSNGGAAVVLLLPAPPVAGDAGEELGLSAPEFQRLTLSPVAVHWKNNGTEVLVPAEALESLLGIAGAGAVETAMRAVSVVQLGDEAYVLTETQAVQAMGRACLYRLVLQMPPTEVV